MALLLQTIILQAALLFEIDEHGSPLLAVSRNIGSSYVHVVEAKDKRESMYSAREKYFSKIQVEDDSKLSIASITSVLLLGA